jgi:hypothetical protein
MSTYHLLSETAWIVLFHVSAIGAAFSAARKTGWRAAAAWFWTVFLCFGAAAVALNLGWDGGCASMTQAILHGATITSTHQ